MTKFKNNIRRSTFLIISLLLVISLAFPMMASAAKLKIAATSDSRIIQNFSATLVSGAQQENGENVWTAANDDTGHTFDYNIAYKFSGGGYTKTFTPGEVVITVPKHILKDNDGNLADDYNIGVPAADEADVDADFVYEEKENNLVITNNKSLPSSTSGEIDISYETIKSADEYTDTGKSDPFVADIKIKTKKETAKAKTDKIPVNIKASVSEATFITADPIDYLGYLSILLNVDSIEFIKSFSKGTQAEYQACLAQNIRIVQLDDGKTGYHIYAWIDRSTGALKWWSNANTVYFPENSSGLFANLYQLQSIDFSGIDMSKITNMSYMFYCCSNLTSLNTIIFDTSNVTDMNHMFGYCGKLTSLDVSDFDTSNVTDMSGMFEGCNNVKGLALSDFDTSKVTDMSDMFSMCEALTFIDVSRFNTSNVTNMSSMFNDCYRVTNLNVSNFNTSKVTDMSNMFNNCMGLTSLNVSNFDTSKVTNMKGMFVECMRLTSLNVSSFDTSKVTNMSNMFQDCDKLTTLDLSSFDTSNVTDMEQMFYFCFGRIKTIYVSNLWNTNKVTNSYLMFASCTSLVGGNGTAFDWDYQDKTYARIDTYYTPGYFTYKAAQI